LRRVLSRTTGWVIGVLVAVLLVAVLGKEYAYRKRLETMNQIQAQVKAAEQQAAAIEAKMSREPSAGSLRTATAEVDVTIEIPADEKLRDDTGGYFSIAIRTQPIITPFGEQSEVVHIGNRRSRWTAVWNLDPADPVIGSSLGNLLHGDNCQIHFNGVPDQFKAISGKVTLTLNGKTNLHFTVPEQTVSNGQIIIPNIAAALDAIRHIH
jgi:hypothetical protein